MNGAALNRRALLGLGALAAAGAFVLWPRGSEADTLSAEEAYRLAATGEIALIDIRRPEEWAATGLPEYAVPIDMRRRDFAEALAAAAAGRPAALICARGGRSGRLARVLAGADPGNRIIDVPEGMMGSSAGAGWLAKSLPVVAVER